MTMTTPEGRELHSALEEAIYLRFGGAVPACHKLKVSTQAIYKLLQTGYVSSRKLALKIQKQTGVPAAELMKLAPWAGPTDRPAGPDSGTRGTRHRPKDAPLLAIVPDVSPMGGTDSAPAPASSRAMLGVRPGSVARPPRNGDSMPERACFRLSQDRKAA